MGNGGWRFAGNELDYLREVLENGFSAGACGSMNERLESAFAHQFGSDYAITANSGTSTLHMALTAVGVQPGDEVIIPALTVAMCGFAVWQCQAQPVFADVLPTTFLLDPEDVARKITPRTRAIMAVQLYGLMCDMDPLLELAARHNLAIIEDCAQCFLGRDSKNRLGGSVGAVGSFSFESSKHLATGEGGVVITSDPELATVMRQFGGLGFKNLTATSGKVRISRDRFQDPEWERHNRMAYNYRLSELGAAVGLAQLERLAMLVELRQAMAREYLKVIADSGTRLLIPQLVPEGYLHSYYTFAARFTGGEHGIPWQEFRMKYVEYGGDGIYAAWKTVNREPAFRDHGIGRGAVPVAEGLQRELMQFTTNQRDESERAVQMEALRRTLDYFGR